MRMLLPPVRERRKIDGFLTAFYEGSDRADFDAAMGSLCVFYRLPKPKVFWYSEIDGGKTLGQVHENGRIDLIDPRNWCERQSENSHRAWIRTFYHEAAHYILWADEERKADLFAHRFIKGL